MSRVFIAIVLSLILITPSAKGQTISIHSNESELDILLVAVYPYDTEPQKTLSEIEDMALNVSNFIDAESYGKLNIKFTIEGWMRLPEPTQAYVTNFSESEFINTRIATDCLDSLSTNADISKYDCLMIVHSGQSYQRSYFGWGIYDCSSDNEFHSGLRTAKRIAIISELGDLATYVRYMLRSFGVPNLYWGWGWDNVGIYSFGIMGGGKAGLCGYTKILLEFLQQEDIYDFSEGTKRILLNPLSSHGSGFRVVRFPISDSEYYMIEARLNHGSDSELLMNGILITYVNETALKGDEPGIKVLRRKDCNSFSHAPLMVGESYYDLDTGFAVRFVDETNQGATIIVSDSPRVEWTYVERLVVPECDRIWNLQLVWYFDEFMEENHLFMSVVTRFGSSTYLRIYDSNNHGRTWSEIVNTLGKANVSSNDGALICHKGEIVYASMINRDEIWFPGLIWKHSYRDEVYYTNLSVLTDANILPWMEMVSENSTLYLAAYSVLNGSCTTYLKLDEAGWSNTTLGLNLGSDFVMLNPLQNKSPNIVFRGATGLCTTAFNSTESTLLTPEITWNIQGLQLDVPYAAFSVRDGDDDWYRLVKIVNGSLQLVLEEKSYSPRCQALSTFNHSITMIVGDANCTRLHLLRNESQEKYNLSNAHTYAMSMVTPNRSVWNPIIAYQGSRVFTVQYDYTTPQEAEPVVWGDVQDVPDILETVPFLTLVFALIGVGSAINCWACRRNQSVKGRC